jgi:prepilin-type N-terminal cleavage/methylation domain-containing protein
MPRLMRRAVRAGYSLVEVLVVMTILGIVGAALTRVMIKAQQSHKDADKMNGGRRELRSGATLLPSEFRSISSAGGDIMAMSESEMVLRAAIGTSIACAIDPVARTYVDIPPLNLAKHTLTSWYTQPLAGDTLFIYNENILKGSEDDKWEKYAIQSVATSAGYCVGAPYTDISQDAGKTRYRLTLVTPPALPDSVKVGAVIRFTRPMKYHLHTGSWTEPYLSLVEFREGLWREETAIAGPFRTVAAGDASPRGLQFRYFDSTGVRLMPPGVDSTRVSRVDVYLRTDRGKSAVTERKGNTLRDSLSFRIAIRNNK